MSKARVNLAVSEAPYDAMSDVDEVVSVAIADLARGDSIRVCGVDPEHLALLVARWADLPPIVVHSRTNEIIDGVHRVEAAKKLGLKHISAIFMAERELDSFALGVQLNVRHGLPLSRQDRRVAIDRLLVEHPKWSDRRIAALAGVAHATVASARRRSSGQIDRSNERVGADYRVRPVDAERGRLRAAEILAERSDATMRDVARAAGVSAATVVDVRRRTSQGLSPVPEGIQRRAEAARAAPGAAGADTPDQPPPAQAAAPTSRASPLPTRTSAAGDLEKLRKDPSFKSKFIGRSLLQLITATMGLASIDLVPAVPAHARSMVAGLSRGCSEHWLDIAEALDRLGSSVNDL